MNTRRPAPRNPRRLVSMVGESAPAVAAPTPTPKPEPGALDDARQGDDGASRKRKTKPAEQEGKTSDRNS